MAKAYWDQLFDFSTSRILDWEISQIREDGHNDQIFISEHALMAASDDNIDADDMFVVILEGKPFEEDLPENALLRAPGISFEMELWKFAPTLVKVGALANRIYQIVTTHAR